jgi:hypothetical protein
MKSLKTLKVIVILLLGILIAWNVVAEPTGPSNIDIVGSSKYPVSSASNVSAIAGNVTELNFIANTVTQTWQGYFGNISGSVKLGDASNNTLYDWTSASPSGEIYATRTSDVPAWASVVCADQTAVDVEDAALGVNQAVDQDSVNRTFLNISFNSFFVGNVNINSTQNCRAVNLYDASGMSSPNFQEVLLHDGTNMIYTALITQDSNGFDARTHDFEMLVGENGHNGDVDVTPYYFYVELG